MIDFNKYKSEISLPDFLINEYNFSPIKGSTKRHPKLQNPVDGQRIIVKKNPQGHYTFFDIDNDQVKGQSILDFVQQMKKREGLDLSLPQVAKILDEYILSGRGIDPDASKYVLENASLSTSQLISISRDLEPMSEKVLPFFIKRGISPEVLEHPIFKGIVFQKEFLDENKVLHNNVVFKMLNFSGDLALSQRNDYFKGCLGDRSLTLATTNLLPGKKVEKIYFAESMLDAISHFSLNYNSLKNSSIGYVSSEGALSEQQILLYSKLLGVMNNCAFSIITDNDLKGQEFACKILAQLEISHIDNVGVSSYDLSKATFHLTANKTDSLINVVTPLDYHISDITRHFKECFQKLNDADKGFSYKILPGKNVSFNLSFETSVGKWEKAFDFLAAFKYDQLKPEAIREKSVFKDFNDDLKRISEINKGSVTKYPFVFTHRSFTNKKGVSNSVSNDANNQSFSLNR